MYSTYQEELEAIKRIASSVGTPAEKIKEAIIEMNIMREKRISREGLMNLIGDYKH
ncbi:hypothetical protein [Clostridium cylindrosporum]|uniref:Uncharacterized protein n=1 Tax=Clostridium cylindrosporum DSM 605 TaxID=1121307 RepID=A0A0J8DA88_CLOCY|nr:hypothetical protein [Clostridium cylindrosporum]KMT22960.1 hypothetical protein CLCY_7c00070 [Clostridium cylindrosporum DSM 605]